MGASKVSQLEDNLQSLAVVDQLSDDLMERIEQILDNKPEPMEFQEWLNESICLGAIHIDLCPGFDIQWWRKLKTRLWVALILKTDCLPVDETSEKEKRSYPGNFIHECDGRL